MSHNTMSRCSTKELHFVKDTMNDKKRKKFVIKKSITICSKYIYIFKN